MAPRNSPSLRRSHAASVLILLAVVLKADIFHSLLETIEMDAHRRCEFVDQIVDRRAPVSAGSITEKLRRGKLCTAEY